MSVWDDPTLGSQNHYVHQRTRSARYNCGASTTTLATRDVAYQLQDYVYSCSALFNSYNVVLWN